MTSAEAALIVVAVVGASLAGAYFHIEKAKRKPSERARIIAAARKNQDVDLDRDVGPDSLRLLQDLDAHLDGYLLENPDVADGFARLRRAIEDHRKGEL